MPVEVDEFSTGIILFTSAKTTHTASICPRLAEIAFFLVNNAKWMRSVITAEWEKALFVYTAAAMFT
jgi:hypothetical protein